MLLPNYTRLHDVNMSMQYSAIFDCCVSSDFVHHPFSSKLNKSGWRQQPKLSFWQKMVAISTDFVEFGQNWLLLSMWSAVSTTFVRFWINLENDKMLHKNRENVLNSQYWKSIIGYHSHAACLCCFCAGIFGPVTYFMSYRAANMRIKLLIVITLLLFYFHLRSKPMAYYWLCLATSKP